MPSSVLVLSPTDVAWSLRLSVVPAATLPTEYTTSMFVAVAAAIATAVDVPATPFTETTVIAEPVFEATRLKLSEPLPLLVTVNVNV